MHVVKMADVWIAFYFRVPEHWHFVFLFWPVILKDTFLLSFSGAEDVCVNVSVISIFLFYFKTGETSM